VSATDDLWIGVDLGGTNVRAALVAADGRVLARARRETRAAEGVDATIGRIVGAIEEVRAGSRVAGVGIGSPGPLDSRRGVVISAPNLPGWVDVPLGDLVRSRVGLETIVENDANVAALGESWLGAGRGASSLLLLTLGTGIGGGIVAGGRVWRGHRGFAGEMGHTTFDPNGVVCGCGNRGCLEQYASATALVRRTREAIAAGRPTSLIAKPAITAAVVHAEALAGDALARELLAETGRILGVAIGSAANLLDPEVVVVAGGLAGAGDFLFGPLREEAKRRALPAVAASLEIVPAALGDDAGVLGAARNAAVESQAY
jgi:glucokinase